MPRIGRSTVEFTFDDTRYRAVFSHRHAREERQGELIVEIPLNHKGIAVRHVTRCELGILIRDIDRIIFERIGIGESLCSLKDVYDWKVGVKTSYIRALQDAGFDATIRGPLLHAFFQEMRIKEPKPMMYAEPIDSTDESRE